VHSCAHPSIRRRRRRNKMARGIIFAS
jgi:hypothetical protein